MIYMNLCIPVHLWQRILRVYQDHPHPCRVLISLVPSVHSQGVSSASFQGHALMGNIPADYWFILCFKPY